MPSLNPHASAWQPGKPPVTPQTELQQARQQQQQHQHQQDTSLSSWGHQRQRGLLDDELGEPMRQDMAHTSGSTHEPSPHATPEASRTAAAFSLESPPSSRELSRRSSLSNVSVSNQPAFASSTPPGSLPRPPSLSGRQHALLPGMHNVHSVPSFASIASAASTPCGLGSRVPSYASMCSAPISIGGARTAGATPEPRRTGGGCQQELRLSPVAQEGSADVDAARRHMQQFANDDDGHGEDADTLAVCTRIQTGSRPPGTADSSVATTPQRRASVDEHEHELLFHHDQNNHGRDNDHDHASTGSEHATVQAEAANAAAACVAAGDDEATRARVAEAQAERMSEAVSHVATPETSAAAVSKLVAEVKIEPPVQIAGVARVGLQDFNFLRMVGQGAFGKVFQVKHKASGQVYAMKVMRKENILRKDHSEYVKAERDVLTAVTHPYIVGLRFSFQTPSKLYLVLDFLNGGHLFFNLFREGVFNEKTACLYTAEIVSALSYLHSKGIMHRDLKPENVLLDNQGHVRLTDFGLAKEGHDDPDERSNSFIGTMEYMAPEIIDGSGHTVGVDWWSTGILLYEMMCGVPPFRNKSRKALQESIKLAKPKYPKFLSTPALSILKGLLTRDPEKRLGCGEDGPAAIKRHAFFKHIDWAKLDRREIESTYKPKVNCSHSVENFDRLWTDQPAFDSPCGTPPAPGAPGASLFKGFTYVEPNFLESIMKCGRSPKA